MGTLPGVPISVAWGAGELCSPRTIAGGHGEAERSERGGGAGGGPKGKANPSRGSHINIFSHEIATEAEGARLRPRRLSYSERRKLQALVAPLRDGPLGPISVSRFFGDLLLQLWITRSSIHGPRSSEAPFRLSPDRAFRCGGGLHERVWTDDRWEFERCHGCYGGDDNHERGHDEFGRQRDRERRRHHYGGRRD